MGVVISNGLVVAIEGNHTMWCTHIHMKRKLEVDKRPHLLVLN